MKKIGIITGSLRRESFSRKVAEMVANTATESLSFEMIDIGKLEIYNQDLDDNPPDEWRKFKVSIQKFDGFIFVTPEYNRSIPAILKNAIDIGSRPYGENSWNGKPGAVISVSPGQTGGFGANHHLRQILVCVNVPVMAGPEAYMGNIMNMLGDNNSSANNDTIQLIKKFVLSFERWVSRNSLK